VHDAAERWSRRNEGTMSFTNVDIGFSERRYSFDAPDFGSVGDVLLQEFDLCSTCGRRDSAIFCVACADRELIEMASAMVMREPTDTMGGGDTDVPDSVGGEDGDVPDTMGDDEDEEEDDDTDSEKV
jgi:hypothetical protein